MSHQTQARSRNAQHAIADKQNKPQQTSSTQQSRTQPTNKQPNGRTTMHTAKHPTRNKSRDTHTPTKTREKQGAYRQAHTRGPSEQHHALENKETPAAAPTRHSHRGIPTPHTQPTPPHPATTPRQESMFPSRAQCANHGPATGERESPRTHPNKGVRPPERRGEPPEHGRDKEKREVHTHRPPEQRRGKPQQAGERTPADSRGIEPHPHNVSEPISSRTLHLAGLLSKTGETKQQTQSARKTRNKNPRTNRQT